jgi:hypothetical protein
MTLTTPLCSRWNSVPLYLVFVPLTPEARDDATRVHSSDRSLETASPARIENSNGRAQLKQGPKNQHTHEYRGGLMAGWMQGSHGCRAIKTPRIGRLRGCWLHAPARKRVSSGGEQCRPLPLFRGVPSILPTSVVHFQSNVQSVHVQERYQILDLLALSFSISDNHRSSTGTRLVSALPAIKGSAHGSVLAHH